MKDPKNHPIKVIEISIPVQNLLIPKDEIIFPVVKVTTAILYAVAAQNNPGTIKPLYRI